MWFILLSFAYMNLVCVIVYQREDNIKKWLTLWGKSNTKDSQLCIIHNQNDLNVKSPLAAECSKAKVIYIPRKNVGMDIGALKDICTGVIPVPDYDFLLWFTDDTLPVRPGFIQEFVTAAKDGVSCYNLSLHKPFPKHIRTVGYCITKKVADNLKFQDSIITKGDCYNFEFGSVEYSLYNQVIRMEITPVQISSIYTSPVWDTGHDKKADRWEEQRKNFNLISPLGKTHLFYNRKHELRTRKSITFR